MSVVSALYALAVFFSPIYAVFDANSTREHTYDPRVLCSLGSTGNTGPGEHRDDPTETLPLHEDHS